MSAPVFTPLDGMPSAAEAALATLANRLPAFPCDDGGPVFNAPWEAQAFAMAVALHQRGVFTWNEWAHMLATVIGEVARRGEPDSGAHYYLHWLTALERITQAKGLVTGTLLRERRAAWEDAARNTPHGQPIELPVAAAS